MTYSNRTTPSCPAFQGPSASTPNSRYETDAYFAAFAPAFQRAAAVLLTLIARAYAAMGAPARVGGTMKPPLKSKKVMILIMAIAIILAALKGSRLEKTMFLKKLFAKYNERLDRIYARYLKWRQRKCWMWGGGFMAACTENMQAALMAACDQKSFDALIPD